MALVAPRAAPRLVVADAVTDRQGVTELSVGDDSGPLRVDVRLAPSVEFTAATVEPPASLEHIVPADDWASIRRRLGRYVIAGRLVAYPGGEPIAGARVTARDAGLVHDDPLGSSVTDDEGRFRIEYDPAAARRTVLPPLQGAGGGAGVYFSVSRDGESLLREPRGAGLATGRRDAGPVFVARLSVDDRGDERKASHERRW
ncbi:hypothetical protein ACIA5D_15505 [Actinoplanes sp. NPDC051513]|uniref:hypothetical protein n=1 Tax=Actinoplanes sp. NPDC051513 TaxID=3363908 RepID=UPI0037AD0A96